MGLKQPPRVDEFSFTGAASHRKLTPSFPGGRRGGEHLPETNVLFKGAKVCPGEKVGGGGRGRAG